VRLVRGADNLTAIWAHCLDNGIFFFCFLYPEENQTIFDWNIYIGIYVKFRYIYIYFRVKMAVRPKHVADNLNKIVNNYSNSVALDGNPWTWSNTRNRMKTTMFKIQNLAYHIKLHVFMLHSFVAGMKLSILCTLFRKYGKHKMIRV
jgi:hypothetical protein